MTSDLLTPALRRQRLEQFAATLSERRRRMAKAEHKTRGYRDEDGVWRGGLMAFVRYFWHVLEPGTPFIEGMPIEAICEHLEAVTFGEITNLLINVFPGAMKSMLTDVFWPAWEWGPMELSHLRYVAFSYAASLTERDNGKFRDLILSPDYQAMYCTELPADETGEKPGWFKLRKIGETKVTNNRHGWKLATSVGGVGTGERGDRIILDDPHNVKESESDDVRNETVRWFREAMSSRLNDMEHGAKIVIMQRVHEADVSGTILEEELPYVHLCIPMEYRWDADENGNPYATEIGWVDPRWQPNPEDCEGELAWPERFPPRIIPGMKKEAGPHAWAGQYQQTPEARGGGIFKRDFWQPWEPGDGKFPPFSYVVASLDSAYTESEENDPSALTVWGIFEQAGYTRVMLVHAWRKFLEFEGPKITPQAGESGMDLKARTMQSWGLVEWVQHTCMTYKVDRLLIEAKASGISAAQSLRKRYGRQRWSINLMQVKGDKVARAHAVQPAFSQEMVYVPWSTPLRAWVAMVIDEMAVFPRGKHRDLTDSATQAIKHLRDLNILVDDDEARAAKVDDARIEAVRTSRAKLPYNV